MTHASTQWRNKFTLGPGAEHKTGPPQVQARRQGGTRGPCHPPPPPPAEGGGVLPPPAECGKKEKEKKEKGENGKKIVIN